MAGVPLWLDQNVHTGCWVQGCRQVQLEGSELKLILPQIIKYIIMLHLHSTRVIQPCVSPTLEVRNQTSGRQSHIQMPAAKQQNQHSHLSNLKAHTPLLPHANLLHRFPSGEDNSCVSTNREETASFLVTNVIRWEIIRVKRLLSSFRLPVHFRVHGLQISCLNSRLHYSETYSSTGIFRLARFNSKCPHAFFKIKLLNLGVVSIVQAQEPFLVSK